MTISAVLLAGGQSSRMGQDKATMLFRGEPLWKNQLDLLRRLQPEELFVSAQTDPPWCPVDVEFVADVQPSRGPLSGITATLSRMAGDYLLVLAVDTPFMTEDYLRDLSMRTEQARGVVPMTKYRAEPLAAIYPRRAITDFKAALVGSNFSLQPLIRNMIALGKLRAIEVASEEIALFRNLNEPFDLETG
jgi:molybdopterin-guanine dinucleotide biosynthesis protein A